MMLVFFLLMNDLFKSSIYQSLYGPFIGNFFFIFRARVSKVTYFCCCLASKHGNLEYLHTKIVLCFCFVFLVFLMGEVVDGAMS